MRELLQIMKALGDANRLRALAALRDRELCLCQIVELLELATSSVSRHMSILENARLVNARKVGRWTYFSRADADASAAVRDAIALVDQTLNRDARIGADRKRLTRILRCDPEVLCRKQSDCKP